MQYEEKEWRISGGAKMFSCEWRPEPEQPVKAVVGLVHGMGEHMGRYGHVGEMLVEAGYGVIGFDQRGHGRTDGKRGHAREYEDLLEGIDLLLADAARLYPGLPVFLYGHSMGGNVTLNYLLRRKPRLAGAIVSSPWLKLATDPSAVQVAAARLIQYVYPAYSQNRPFKPNHLTSDPEMVRRYTEDKQGHGFISAKFFFGMRKAGLWAIAHASELPLPILLMHAGADTVTSIKASRQFAENAPPSLCTFREWPGFRHELHNELKREEVFAAIKEWLDGRLNEIPKA